jgi:hypothetical protein
MTFEPAKFLQNVELRLRGRAAILVAGEAAFVVSLWLLMKGYSDHPIFSTVGASLLIFAMFGFTGLGLLGRARPDEPPEKSLTHVTQLGVVIAQGIGSQRDLVQLIRELNGMKRLPPPTHSVRGSATNEADYVPLSDEQSHSLVEQIEQGVEKYLEEAVKDAIGQAERPQLEDSSLSKLTQSSVVKGKKLSP